LITLPPKITVDTHSETMRLLVMSREVAALRSLWSLVESNTWHLETVNTGWEAMEHVQSGLAPHLLIIDVPRKDGDSLYVVRWARRFRPELRILVLCHAEDADKKDDALRLGADDVLVRPFSDDRLESVIRGYVHHIDRTNRTTAGDAELVDDDISFVSISPIMRKVRAQAELLAQSDVPVLILGERGSGRETVARLIHRLSVRSGFTFQKVQCAALPAAFMDGELSRALESHDSHTSVPDTSAKGMLLLDEITGMPSALQLRLLNALESWHDQFESPGMLGRHVRLLVSSSANIERALAERKLREDLYYRLSSFTVHVPPLRQRTEDIRALLRQFMQRLSNHYGLPAREFPESTIERCGNHSWPGNLTELEAFVKRYLVAGESDAHQCQFAGDQASQVQIDPSESAQGVEESSVNPTSLKSLVRSLKCETERNAIAVALEKTGWNRKAAARLLRVSYRTLLYKIEEYRMNETNSGASLLTYNEHALGVAGSKDKAS